MKLERAVEKWIKAEWAFRLGPHAYDTKPMHNLIEAEEQLRKAVTGQKGLNNAAAEIGIDTSECKKRDTPETPRRPKRRKKRRRLKKKSPGLFDS